jgi:hypothetical protein
MLLVVARRHRSGDEPASLIEATRVDVALKRPELEPGRTPPHRMVEQCPSDAASRQSGVDIELIDPLMVQHHESDDLAQVLSDPDLMGLENHLPEPPDHFLVGVDGRWNRRNRRCPGSEPQRSEGARLAREGSPDLHGT